jgi:hypothetical protein
MEVAGLNLDGDDWATDHVPGTRVPDFNLIRKLNAV